MALDDGHAAQTGDRLKADDLNELRASARSTREQVGVEGVNTTRLPGGSYVQLDDSIRNPENINEWFLAEIVTKPVLDPPLPDLEGAMYWVTEVQDASYIEQPNRMRLENSQIARERWLDLLPRVPTGDQTVSSYDANKEQFIPRLVVAANLAEMDARNPENDVSTLATGLAVKVFMLRSNDETPRYYFSIGGGLQARQFIIVAIHDEHLECHTWNGNPDDEGALIIKVARPWGLRAYPETYTQDGKTYEYRTTQERLARIAVPPGRGASAETELQFVTPSYYTRNVVLGLGGVRGGVISPLLDALPGGVDWLDITPGREWAAFGAQ